MGKDLKIGVSKSSSFDIKDTNKKKMDKFYASNMKKVDDKLNTCMQLGCENDAPRNEPLGANKTSNAHKEALKSSHLIKSINIKDKSMYYSKVSPALELSLKRIRDVDDADMGAEERILRHFRLSDFLRDNTISNVNQSPTLNADSCSPPDISSEAAKPINIQSNSNGTPNNRSNACDDMASISSNAFKTKPDDQLQQPPNGSTTLVVHNHHTSTPQPPLHCAIEGDATVKTTLGQPNPMNQQVQVRHHHHHYHHHHHHLHKLQKPKIMEPDDGSLRNMVSSILTASSGENAANFGENGDSWPKRGGSDPLLKGGKIESDHAAGKNTNGGDRSGSISCVDQERLARREAALNKFRQKRKERCFEKKVRYENKKKLADQRPRVRGQFVKHGVQNEHADS